MSPPPVQARNYSRTLMSRRRQPEGEVSLRAFPYNRFRQLKRPEFPRDPDHSG